MNLTRWSDWLLHAAVAAVLVGLALAIKFSDAPLQPGMPILDQRVLEARP